ncbi:thioredoxin-like protein [Phlyctochytrium arcticum]|nr:thioredoxin-like protein [Phlyctochytrium arcticum]
MNTIHDSDSDDDKLFAELEADDDHFVAAHREVRLGELKREAEKLKNLRENAFGTYDTISKEKEVLDITTTTPKVVAHFAHKNFRRCQLMDEHVNTLSRKHPFTRFIRVDVENVPFLVERLKIKVLPCLIPFIDGSSVDRLVGFEGVGDSENVPTSAIEEWLIQTKVISSPDDVAAQRKTIFGFPDKYQVDSDEDDD